MKNLFHIRTPFWQLMIYGLFFVAMGLHLYVSEYTVTSILGIDSFTFVNWLLVVVVILALTYGALILSYNHRHPKAPIRYFGLLPPELKEEDEGMRAFTAKATRRVYIFHATFLPIFGMTYAYLLPSPLIVLGGIAFLTLGHFIIYWNAIWPVWQNSDE